MLIRAAVPAALDRPVLTGVKRIQAAQRQRWRDQGYLAPLDPAALSRKYGGDQAYAPRAKKAVFRVPLGVSEASFQKEQSFLVWRWLRREAQYGWEWCSDRRIDVYPGHYPAHDIDEYGNVTAVLDHREFIARAWFTQKRPELIRTEIRPELLEPLVLPGAPEPTRRDT